MLLIGHGFDVHPFKENRKLILGGVTIEHELGLDGHSDADVAIHALIDAILGALGQGDIGRHFPDTNPEYKNISSRKLLIKVAGMMKNSGYSINNADITIHAEAPKLADYMDEMRGNIADDLNCPDNRINIKATTWEKLGFIGRGEGIAADAVVLLVSTDSKSDEDKIKETETKPAAKPLQLVDDDTPIEHRVKTKGTLTIYTDGASRGNPGPSSAGAVILDSSGNTLKEISMFLGTMTNNQAEYQALILALKEASSLRPERLVIRMDSQLIVRQISGEYKVKDAKLKPLFALVIQQLKFLKSWDIEHIPRNQNNRADTLANKALDRA
ncbi:2-C-methyl-D-erythritol 2,4-cyclodiphosphate synthase [bacterium]|nr:2-C-methyl-D-erythritol 2,4-cyclodiphosphate synthase [bacterium]